MIIMLFTMVYVTVNILVYCGEQLNHSLVPKRRFGNGRVRAKRPFLEVSAAGSMYAGFQLECLKLKHKVNNNYH